MEIVGQPIFGKTIIGLIIRVCWRLLMPFAMNMKVRKNGFQPLKIILKKYSNICQKTAPIMKERFIGDML